MRRIFFFDARSNNGTLMLFTSFWESSSISWNNYSMKLFHKRIILQYMKILPLLHLQYQSIKPPMTQLRYSTHCSYKKDISFHENWQGDNYLEVKESNKVGGITGLIPSYFNQSFTFLFWFHSLFSWRFQPPGVIVLLHVLLSNIFCWWTQRL